MTPWHQGFAACLQGLPTTANPFDESNDRNISWRQGWLTAEKENWAWYQHEGKWFCSTSRESDKEKPNVR
jgi:hypothetical protein